MEYVRFNCSHCGHKLKVKAAKCGKSALCPHCKGKIHIPEESSDSANDTVSVHDGSEDVEETEWYVAINGEQQGPFVSKNLKEKIAEGHIDSKSLVWREGMEDWQSADSVPELEIRERNKAENKEEESDWYVEVSGEQYGPLDKKKIIGMLEAGQINNNSFAWCTGMEDWQPISSIPGLADKQASGSLNSDVTYGVGQFNKRDLSAVINSGILLIILIIAGAVVSLLPGTDVRLGRGTLATWIESGIAIVVLGVLLRLLKPLKSTVAFYIGLIFRVSSGRYAGDQDLQTAVSSSGMSAVMLIYVAIIYQAVLPSLISSIRLIVNIGETIENLIRLGFAVIGIVIIVRFVITLKPLIQRWTNKLTDRTTELTEKANSRECSGCGSRISLTAKFCPECGHQPSTTPPLPPKKE